MAAYTKVRDRSAGNCRDIALVLRARDGDIAAFESLYLKYRKLIVCWVRTWLRYEEWVDEFTDDAINVLRSKLPEYRSERASFCSWAYRVARSAAIKHARVVGTKLAVVPIDLLMEDELPAFYGPEYDFLSSRVEEEVIRLEPEQRAAVYGYFYEGKTDDEIAEELHIPRRRVCYRRRQGLAVLRKRLSDVFFKSIRPETRFSGYYCMMTDVRENIPALMGERG